MADPLLELENVKRRYGRKYALKGLSIKVARKSITAFIGANGAGKTTAFSLIGGFIKPHGGTIKIAGMSLRKYFLRGGTIGILPQDAGYLENRSVYRQLYLFSRLSGFSNKRGISEALRVLHLVGLEDYANYSAHELSHGMRVRLGVAQALVGNPPLILLDEPTAGLDPKMLSHFREIIRRVRGTTTIFISSHDLSELQSICDNVCMIDRGTTVLQGPMSQMLRDSSRIVYWLKNFGKNHQGLVAAFPDIQFSFEDESRVIANFNPQKISVPEVNKMILSWCLEKGISVLEVEAKKSLEQTFFEETMG
jgi:ABC-2 type transport system ATP-binding protein